MKGLPFTILLVDDDQDDREIIDEAFQHVGYEPMVKKFINGKALLHYMEQIDSSLYPSLIVLDNTLPGMDATDLLTILKTTPAYRQIPVIIYTTYLNEFKEKELKSKGAYRCLQKGLTLNEVIQVAEELKKVAEGK